MRYDTALISVGCALVLGIFFLGFIRVDEATWLEWKYVWLLGSGGGMGLGVSLIIIGIIKKSV